MNFLAQLSPKDPSSRFFFTTHQLRNQVSCQVRQDTSRRVVATATFRGCRWNSKGLLYFLRVHGKPPVQDDVAIFRTFHLGSPEQNPKKNIDGGSTNRHLSGSFCWGGTVTGETPGGYTTHTPKIDECQQTNGTISKGNESSFQPLIFNDF